MTSLNAVYSNEVTCISSTTSSTTSSNTVVAFNGALDSSMSPKATTLASQRVSSSGSSSAQAVTSSDSSPSSTIFSIVPTLTTTSRVVVTSSSVDSVSSSSNVNKLALVGSTDLPQIVVVSEADGTLDSTSDINRVGAVQAPTVNLGVGEAYVQYVDAPQDPIYSHTNGQIAYPVYTVGETTMYDASSTFYPAGSAPATFSREITNSANGPPILSTGSNTFILHSDVEPESAPIITSSRHSPSTDNSVAFMVNEAGTVVSSGDSITTTLDAEAHVNIAQAHAKVSPATVKWLLENYETAEGVSLPRSTLYNHYLYHCADQKLDPVNSASFGKLIRSCFMGLRTRRLGTRGNSKYHYYGIRLKLNSSLNNLSEDGSHVVFRNQGGGQKCKSSLQEGQDGSRPVNSTSVNVKGASGGESCENTTLHNTSEASPQTVLNQQYLGDLSQALPLTPVIDSESLPSDISTCDVETFRTMYQEHCENILEIIYNLQFGLMDTIWSRFWCLNNNNVEKASSVQAVDEEGEMATKFSSNTLQSMLRCTSVLDFVKKVDYEFYQNLVDVLIPDVLRSIPSPLTQSIRNFAKSLEGWLSNALLGYPSEFIEVKITAVSSLAQTLRRYTSLNHLAQAARAVLQNSTQISQMLSDLNRVDFHNVQEQASWVCQCDVGLVERLEEDFKSTLQQQNSLEQWAEWLQTVVNQLLVPQEGNPNFSKYARQFLLKWSFYSSMVIRDLTLRSAASFGSFHLIRLLYDEYMFYLVERKVASSLNLTPIAVMSQYLSSSKVQNSENVNPSVNGEHIPSPIKRLKCED